MPENPLPALDRRALRWTLTGLCAVALLTATTACSSPQTADRPQAAVSPSPVTGDQPNPVEPAVDVTPSTVTGLGPQALARIPTNSRQVLVVTGRGANSPDSSARLWIRDAAGRWTPAGPSWPAHNALDGWTTDHHSDDLHSPIGVFTLSDAGGKLSNPGTALPYYHSGSFTITGQGFEGEPLAGAFDYVIAIDYNRVRGRSPLDYARPLGSSRGGGIWLHVDHGGPTHGCVTLARGDLKALLMTLDPAEHPVIVMGPQDYLAR